MNLTNAAHEHFTAQTGKKSKTALKNFMGPGGPRGRGPTYGAESREKQIPHKHEYTKYKVSRQDNVCT